MALLYEVVYIDHTIVNIFIKGTICENLGKPVLTIAVDGALSKVRAFVLWFRSASVDSVLMLLRDYVIRNGCLPRIIVLDNGKEFHSDALKLICSLFKLKFVGAGGQCRVTQRWLSGPWVQLSKKLFLHLRAIPCLSKIREWYQPVFNLKICNLVATCALWIS